MFFFLKKNHTGNTTLRICSFTYFHFQSFNRDTLNKFHLKVHFRSFGIFDIFMFPLHVIYIPRISFFPNITDNNNFDIFNTLCFLCMRMYIALNLFYPHITKWFNPVHSKSIEFMVAKFSW